MNKPLPKPNADTRPFWDACAERRFLFQRCDGCGAPQFYPRALCHECGSTDVKWEESERRGMIYSFTEAHVPASAAFKDDTPYVVLLVRMNEGFNFITNLRGDRARLAIGAPGRIVFEEREGTTLPFFELD